MKKKIFAALDVGTTKVCSIIATVGDSGTFRIFGVGVTPTKGMRKGMVVNLDEAKESIRESVKKAEHASGIKMESAYVGITGSHISSLNTRSAVAISRGDRLVSPKDLKRLLEEARSIKVPSDRRLLHVVPKGYILDGHEGVKNPIGMHGFRLDADTHLVTASVAAIQNLVKAVRGAGIEVEDLVLEPLAAGEAVLRPDEKEAGVALVDIGGGTTDIAIFEAGNVSFTTVLPVGGYQVSRDIAIGFNIPFELAEKIKIKYGNLLLSGEAAKSKIDGSQLGLKDDQDILLSDLMDIIRARVDEILRMVYAAMPQSEYLSSLIPAGLVLTGGTANLPGIDALARDIFRLPVRIGVPKDIYGLADILYNPAFATSVGLLLWGARDYRGEWRASKGKLSAFLSPFRRFFKK